MSTWVRQVVKKGQNIANVVKECPLWKIWLTYFYCTTSIGILQSYGKVTNQQAHPYALFDHFCQHTNYSQD